ncbi:MAG: acyloxyacyl hydrolase [Rickettsiaceae bacterium]|nr:acyloxyacyl hydrolase [Rickettsiaceae bacterium]MDP4832253.1 acyloxyacyl hydrolase [Rickettsiaceae bacterium]MDP5021184.1 acyloxyacyl hydrolase [Rickettsiaceae bacterium]MDP5083577.1 acyloxyacyl hydrolase [Rickettsiaceae bacterium]
MRHIFCLIQLFSLIFLITTANAQEIKIGIMQHDFDKKFKHRHEKGQNIILEYMSDKTQNFLRAFPHIGASINNKGYTSNIYTGLTWQFDLGENFLIEASLGASINNAERKKTAKKRALGSNILFRESLSAGFRFDTTQSLTIIIDHMSSADISKPNPGLTDIGIRYGYRF